MSSMEAQKDAVLGQASSAGVSANCPCFESNLLPGDRIDVMRCLDLTTNLRLARVSKAWHSTAQYPRSWHNSQPKPCTTRKRRNCFLHASQPRSVWPADSQKFGISLTERSLLCHVGIALDWCVDLTVCKRWLTERRARGDAAAVSLSLLDHHLMPLQPEELEVLRSIPTGWLRELDAQGRSGLTVQDWCTMTSLPGLTRLRKLCMSPSAHNPFAFEVEASAFRQIACLRELQDLKVCVETDKLDTAFGSPKSVSQQSRAPSWISAAAVNACVSLAEFAPEPSPAIVTFFPQLRIAHFFLLRKASVGANDVVVSLSACTACPDTFAWLRFCRQLCSLRLEFGQQNMWDVRILESLSTLPDLEHLDVTNFSVVPWEWISPEDRSACDSRRDIRDITAELLQRVHETLAPLYCAAWRKFQQLQRLSLENVRGINVLLNTFAAAPIASLRRLSYTCYGMPELPNGNSWPELATVRTVLDSQPQLEASFSWRIDYYGDEGVDFNFVTKQFCALPRTKTRIVFPMMF
jgi:hypothetical protein